jgi:hypothetical protein
MVFKYASILPDKYVIQTHDNGGIFRVRASLLFSSREMAIKVNDNRNKLTSDSYSILHSS